MRLLVSVLSVPSPQFGGVVQTSCHAAGIVRLQAKRWPEADASGRWTLVDCLTFGEQFAEYPTTLRGELPSRLGLFRLLVLAAGMTSKNAQDALKPFKLEKIEGQSALFMRFGESVETYSIEVTSLGAMDEERFQSIILEHVHAN